MMDSTEETALRQLRLQFVRRLDVTDYVLDYIEQEGGLSDLLCEKIREKARTSRSVAATDLIDAVLQKSVVSIFLEGLECGDSHLFLAKLLKDKITELNQHRQTQTQRPVFSTSLDQLKNEVPSFGSSFSKGFNSDIACDRASRDPDETNVMKLSTDFKTDGGGGLDAQPVVPVSKSSSFDTHVACKKTTTKAKGSACKTSRSQPEIITDLTSDDETETEENKELCVIHPQPKRVDIMDRKKRTLTKIHYHLKLLSHDGQQEKFAKFVSKHKKRFFYDADIMFTLLDAEVESRRLVYDEGLHKGDIFIDLEQCIIKSSHPIANTVMFLARKGSARTMKESLEVGLDMLEEARALSGQIKPCKDTGMVLYILINILIQMYEAKPCLKLKEKIIATIDEAIHDHFAESPPFLREDYTRMLYLKMVFCYLGIGLFGNPIKHCDVSRTDVNSAKTCLDIIDKSQAKFDSRREMFYFMAKSVMCKKLGHHQEALDYAETAKRKAMKCGFRKELGPIMELTGGLEKSVAEDNEYESEQREEEIESELNDLERQRSIAMTILRKPSNQWGNV